MARVRQPNGWEIDPALWREALAEHIQFFTFDATDGSQYTYAPESGLRLAALEGNKCVSMSLPALGITVEKLCAQNPDLTDASHQRYAKNTDTSVPVLFIPSPQDEREIILIDGWHRIYRALTEQIEIVPAYLLTREQADRIIMLYCPPGTVPAEEADAHATLRAMLLSYGVLREVRDAP